MKGKTNVLLTLTISCLLLLALLVAINPALAANEDKGGTDGDIEVEGDAGGGFEWNEVHGFVMIEDGTKVGEEFNITLCQKVKYNSQEEKFTTSGHIFGELHEIVWDQQPEPSIIIPREELEEYKSEGDDTVNTTVYILGEYYREDPYSGEDELRQAYKKIQVQRPNHAPKPIAMITSSDENDQGIWDNWSRLDSNDDDELIYYIDQTGISVKFWLNGSESTDEDGDNITEYRWDLDGNGLFGENSKERQMNTTVYLGEGDYLLGLMVGDGNKISEPPLDIRIVVKTPIRYPDLTIQQIEVVNKNGQVDIFKGDRCNVIAYVKNIGDNESNEKFDVYFEFWYRDSSPNRPDWIELDRTTFAETIEVNSLKLIEVAWDTGSVDFPAGTYSFRATVDYNEEIKEVREQNNVFPAPDDEMDAENITLQETGTEEPPNISIKDIVREPDKPEAWVNELIYINITILNTGNGDAKYVDIHYFINNEFQHFQTIDLIERNGGERTETFVFSGDTNNTFRIRFEVYDNNEKKDESDTFTIRVFGNIPHNGGNGGGGGTGGGGSEEGNEMIPIVIAVVVIVGGVAGAGFFFMRKKDEDVW